MKLTSVQKVWLDVLRIEGFVPAGGYGNGQKNRPLRALVEKGYAIEDWGPKNSMFKCQGFLLKEKDMRIKKLVWEETSRGWRGAVAPTSTAFRRMAIATTCATTKMVGIVFLSVVHLFAPLKWKPKNISRKWLWNCWRLQMFDKHPHITQEELSELFPSGMMPIEAMSVLANDVLLVHEVREQLMKIAYEDCFKSSTHKKRYAG